MDTSNSEKILNALDHFRIELPSRGFANTGTRFGKFIQPAAATTTEEKFSDAGQVHLLTGVYPTIALHVLWDCPDGLQSSDEIRKLADRHGVRPGSINPNLSRTRNTNTTAYRQAMPPAKMFPRRALVLVTEQCHRRFFQSPSSCRLQPALECSAKALRSAGSMAAGFRNQSWRVPVRRFVARRSQRAVFLAPYSVHGNGIGAGVG